MKITGLESLHADAGWRVFSFLKLTTDQPGLIGWSEYNESAANRGLTAAIHGLGALAIGEDPLAHERLHAKLYAATRQVSGGISTQAMAAIENAALDAKAKSLGVPVHALFGGPLREQLRLYWSHCGNYRLGPQHRLIGKAPIVSLDDVAAAGREVRERGFTALKTNPFRFEGGAHIDMPGFGRGAGWPELNWDAALVEALAAQMAAFRDGAGPGIDLMLDLNFNFKTEGFLRIARRLEPLGLAWLEIDSRDAAALASIRRGTRIPVASCESLYGTRGYRPYFENQSMDVAIVDVVWNGLAQALKIAAMAEAYEVNVAPHNYFGPICTLMSAHFCAALPNFRIMELDVDDVPWRDELVTRPAVIERGSLLVPSAPGWGAEVDEAAVKRHPPKS
jgi:L-alanine-DL-glutamate epimerase-like enolase superfamily enzyme